MGEFPTSHGVGCPALFCSFSLTQTWSPNYQERDDLTTQTTQVPQLDIAPKKCSKRFHVSIHHQSFTSWQLYRYIIYACTHIQYTHIHTYTYTYGIYISHIHIAYTYRIPGGFNYGISPPNIGILPPRPRQGIYPLKWWYDTIFCTGYGVCPKYTPFWTNSTWGLNPRNVR